MSIVAQNVSQTIDVALGYAASGWHVFPVKPRDKRPMSGVRWRDESTTDPDTIRAWWTRWPDANIGLDCGKSGLLVLDFDAAKPDFAGQELLDRVFRLSTAHTKTGGDGYHFFFLQTEDKPLGNSRGNLPTGVDVRGAGGYVVLPPSLHPLGKRYAWLDMGEPAPLPDFIRKLLNPTQLRAVSGGNGAHLPVGASAYARRAIENEVRAVASAHIGTRNETLNRAAFNLGQLVAGGELGWGEVEDALLEAAQAAGLPEREARATIASGLNGGAHYPRSAPTLLANPPSGNGRNVRGVGVRESDFPLDDYGNAQLVMALHPDQFAHTTTHGWLTYVTKHGYWTTEFDDAAAKKTVSEVLRWRIAQAWTNATDDEGVKRAQEVAKACRPSAHRVRAVLDALRTLAFTTIGDLENHASHLLNVRNGVVDLRTGALMPHSPNYGFLYVVPVDYDPQAAPSEWVNFLRSAVGDEMLEWLQMAVGYSITGDTREEVLFYLLGPKRAGKGTFTETINAMLGSTLAKEVSFGIFTVNQRPDDQNFALAPLHQARMVFASESNRYERFNEAKIKRLTGGNDIYCAFKRRDFFTYRPQFKIWLSSNHPVNADPDDDAVWSRIQVIPFPHSFAGQEDRTLKSRLKSPESLRGVLAWAVAGAVRWYQAGHLPRNAVVEVTTQSQRERLDNVQAWLDERVALNSDSRVEFATVWADYSDWCKLNGVRPRHKQGLSEVLRKKGFIVRKMRYEPGSDRKKVFVLGISIET